MTSEPPFDLLEEGGFLFVEIALPGVLETDIDITFDGTRMTLRAQRPAARGQSLHAEIQRGILLRDVTLPCTVELLSSRYEDGILWLQLKRLEVR